MNLEFWRCCGKNYVNGISKCRKCGKPKPVYGIKDEPRAIVKKSESKPRKKRALKDPHISDDPDKFFVSTCHRLD